MSLLSVLRSGEPALIFAVIFSRIFVVFFCLPIHELAHGWAAYKMGDSTAKNLGRLTFNPFAHLDLFGTIMLFLFGIGYANPVPVQTRNFRNPKKGMIVTALAGPGSNLLMAFVFICLYYIVLLLPQNLAVSFIAYFFDFAATVNVSLAVFNLLPIPPLDGSKVIGFLIPSKTYFKILQYERYIMIALLLLLFTGVLNMPIALISDLLMKVISFLPSLIYNLIV
ncbi:MAG: site-2 protease family protein [Eubacterium sp.]|nr:site-2 protease family protein [Eubacterium sp.]